MMEEELKRIIDSIKGGDYESIRPYLWVQMCRGEYGKQEREHIYSRHGAWTATYYIRHYFKDKDREAKIAVSPEMLQSWGIDKAILHQDAVQSMAASDPPKLQRISELILQKDPREAFDYLSGSRPCVKDDLYVLTSSSGMGGSGYITHPELRERIGGLLGGDYYILPTSIHEMMVIGNTGILPKDLARILYQGNHEKGIIASDEFVSDIIQVYKTETKDLKPYEPYAPEPKIHAEKKPVHRKLL